MRSEVWLDFGVIWGHLRGMWVRAWLANDWLCRGLCRSVCEWIAAKNCCKLLYWCCAGVWAAVLAELCLPIHLTACAVHSTSYYWLWYRFVLNLSISLSMSISARVQSPNNMASVQLNNKYSIIIWIFVYVLCFAIKSDKAFDPINGQYLNSII